MWVLYQAAGIYPGESSRRHYGGVVQTRKGETFWANTMQALTKKAAASHRWAMGVKINKTNLKAWEGMVVRTIKKRSPLFIRRLISGMKTRVEALVKNKGGPIRW